MLIKMAVYSMRGLLRGFQVRLTAFAIQSSLKKHEMSALLYVPARALLLYNTMNHLCTVAINLRNSLMTHLVTTLIFCITMLYESY